MKIIDKLARDNPAFSFEFFPPKDEAGVDQLFRTVQDLRPYEPTYVSVTWGAGGSTRRLTVDLVGRIKRETGIEAMAHLTCVGATAGDIDGVLEQFHEAGIENVLPLRGDPPKGQTEFVQSKDGLRYANDLVTLLRARHADFCLGVAGYPEKHPEAPTAEVDLANLKRKVDAGAAFVTTQLFFDNALYYRFVEKCRAAGISVPIVPGIMPVLSLKQIQRFAAMCGASLPPQLVKRLEAAGDQPEVMEAVGIDWALHQIRDLLAQGTPGYHLYVLNRAKSALALAAGLAA